MIAIIILLAVVLAARVQGGVSGEVPEMPGDRLSCSRLPDAGRRYAALEAARM